MKKIFFSFTYVVILFLFLSCSKGSSGTAMLNLGEIRVVPDPDALESRDGRPFAENLATVFTVLPGPYEFVWEEIKDDHGALGYEQCVPKLKLKLRLNKKLQYTTKITDRETSDFLSGKVVVPGSFKSLYTFHFLDAEGKENFSDGIYREMLDTHDLANIWSADENRIIDNTDGLLDFYRFLTGESGNEFELVVPCQVVRCSKIKTLLENTKSLIIKAHSGYYFQVWKVVDL